MTVVKSIMREEFKKIGFDLPIEPSLIGMEEGVALYQLHKIGVSNEDSYIYTDLDGKILFSNNTFYNTCKILYRRKRVVLHCYF